MKTKFLSIIIIVAVILLSAFTVSSFKADIYKVDIGKSSLTWTGKKVVGGHNGSIELNSGNLLFNGKKLAGGNFAVNMASIKDVDKSARLESHLKSDDFFGTEKFPVSDFSVKKVAAGSGNTINITGDLTIKGITHPVTFPATITWNSDRTVTAIANKIIVDRTKYGIKYRSEGIMDIGDKFIYDDFELSVKLVAKK